MEMKNAAEPRKERPFPCRAEEVMAILDGRKTQTRRLINPQPRYTPNDCWSFYGGGTKVNYTPTVPEYAKGQMEKILSWCPYSQPGDRLWVRETWFQGKTITKRDQFSETTYPAPIRYRADGEILGYGQDWKPSIHMPRWASRITLEITNVRVERAQEISSGDIIAEGVDFDQPPHDTDRLAFARLWDSINAERGFGWDKNPWVWVLEFWRIK